MTFTSGVRPAQAADRTDTQAADRTDTQTTDKTTDRTTDRATDRATDKAGRTADASTSQAEVVQKTQRRAPATQSAVPAPLPPLQNSPPPASGDPTAAPTAPTPAQSAPAQPTTAAPAPVGTISAGIEPGLYRIERGPDGQSLQATPVDEEMLAATAGAAENADAALMPTPRSFFMMSAGGSVDFVPGGGVGYASYYNFGMTFLPELAVGRYLKNKPNFGIGFAGSMTKPFYGVGFRLGARFQWDKRLSSKFPVYASSKLTAGLEISVPSYYSPVGGFVEFGWGLDALVSERIILSFRPVNLSLSYAGSLPGVRWSVLGGVGYRW